MAQRGKIEGWTRQLEDERLEIFLKVEGVQGMQDRKIRASGPVADMYELVDWFESKTGMTVNVPNRIRTTKPLPGQMELTTGELSSEETEPTHA